MLITCKQFKCKNKFNLHVKAEIINMIIIKEKNNKTGNNKLKYHVQESSV